MHKLCKVAMGVAFIGWASGVIAAEQSSLPKQFTTTSSTGTQQVAVRSDGTIEAQNAEPGLTTHITIRVVGHAAIIRTDDGISTTTKVVDLDANTAWLKSHPDLALKVQNARTWLLQHRKSTHAPLMAALGGTCSTELQRLLDAADAAVAACSGGGGLMCAIAVGEYGKANDAYDNCMKVISPPRQE